MVKLDALVVEGAWCTRVARGFTRGAEAFSEGLQGVAPCIRLPFMVLWKLRKAWVYVLS